MFNAFKNWISLKCLSAETNSQMLSNEVSNTEEEEEEVMDADEWHNWDQIEEHLYVGNYESATDSQILKELNIKYVLSVINEELAPKYDSIEYFHINADDFPLQDLLTYFPQTNDFISKGQKSGANVLVHCVMGMSRSVTIVIAYLMAKYKMPYISALDLVKSKRNICPNYGFKAQLQLYEEMSFSLNANNQKLRKLLVENVLHSETPVFCKWTNNIKSYFERLQVVEQMTKDVVLGQNYLCSKCGFKLFNEINVMKNLETKRESDSSPSCKWVYIEPQKWMKELFEFVDNMANLGIKCPHCHQELVTFNRRFATHLVYCCSYHMRLRKSLRFRVEKSKFKVESNK